MTEPELDIGRLITEHYEEADMETAFPADAWHRTRQAVASRAQSRWRMLAPALAAAAVLAALLLWSLPGPLGNWTGALPLTAGRAKPLLVVLTARGEVKDGKGKPVKVGDEVRTGATLRTGKASYLLAVTRQGSGVVLDSQSELTLARDGKQLALRRGKLYCRNWQHEFSTVTTSAGKIRLLGTAIAAAMEGKQRVAVTVADGEIKLENSHGSALVPAGHKSLLLASAAPDDGAAADVKAETLWVEGTLYWRSAEDMRPGGGWNPVTHALTGSAASSEGMPNMDSDRSPIADEIVYSDDITGTRPTSVRVYRRKLDGTEVNLTERAGLSGVNCHPKWSPDGRMIAFQHCDATTGKPPCQEGFRVMVMDADGTDAHALAPAGTPSNLGPEWTPDGKYLTVEVKGAKSLYLTDPWGRKWREFGALMVEFSWSPDGRHLVYTAREADTQDGMPGLRHELVLADADGANPRVLVQQFLADEDIARHYPTPEQKKADPEIDWIADLNYWIGPLTPRWSPSGDQIGFVSALPFDPAGPYYRMQTQVWIYDLASDRLVQVTYDKAGHYGLVWERTGGDYNGAAGAAAAPETTH